jgi:2-hydroxychromene-2-carboxylate isomerase
MHNPRDLQFTTKQGEILEPGIHYDLSMEDYLSIKALSRSGIKDLIISPLNFWRNSPFNPQREVEEKEALTIGEAHHARFLEGKEVFESRFAPEFDARPAGMLSSSDELKDRLKELGLKLGTTNLDRARMIREEELKLQEQQPDVPLTPLKALLELEYAEKHKGKKFIPASKYRNIENAAQAVEADPELAQYLRGGKPEVTLLWRDPTTGVPLKARCDYLTDDTWLEFKTFTNMKGIELDRAVADAMANRKYGLQAILSLTGLEELGHAVKRAIFLFQETSSMPDVVPRLFNRTGIDHNENAYWMRPHMEVTTAIHAFADYYSRFGEEPWREPAELRAFEDEHFPAWAR